MAAPVKEPSSSPQENLNGYEVSELTPSQAQALLSGTNTSLTEAQRTETSSDLAKGTDKPMKERLLTPSQASDLLGVSRETLRHWRRTGYGPPVAKPGERTIRYPEGPLKAWIRRHTLFPEKLSDNAEEVIEAGTHAA